jgi:hypothetical protein
VEDRERIEGFLRRIDPEVADEAAAIGQEVFRLLPGEEPLSPDLADAEHWTMVYGELERFTEAILDALPQATKGGPDRMALEHAEEERTLRGHLVRLRAHRRYWEERSRLGVNAGNVAVQPFQPGDRPVH